MIGTVTGKAGKAVRVDGYAQDFGERIAAVQFSCDDGATWTSYETPNMDTDANVNWSFSFTPPTEGRYELLVRAVRPDGRATPQPARIQLDIAPAR